MIDEQHRFGVEQRALLRGKGDEPDVLVMTATPIPRTAAMLVYGDLDKSELREMPPGRTPIATDGRRPEPARRRPRRGSALRAEVAAGPPGVRRVPARRGQAARSRRKAATEESSGCRPRSSHGLRLGLLHGQMPAAEKEAVMAAFRAGELDVLVATTVIEVGVDVPNATVMIVEDADRFGLSQLHQLRGRVGRGARRVVLLPVRRPDDARRRGAHGGDGGVDRRVRCSPRRTSRSAARARCSASASRGAATSSSGGIPRDEAIVIEARARRRGDPRRRSRPRARTRSSAKRSRTSSATPSSSCSRA